MNWFQEIQVAIHWRFIHRIFTVILRELLILRHETDDRIIWIIQGRSTRILRLLWIEWDHTRERSPRFFQFQQTEQVSKSTCQKKESDEADYNSRACCVRKVQLICRVLELNLLNQPFLTRACHRHSWDMWREYVSNSTVNEQLELLLMCECYYCCYCCSKSDLTLIECMKERGRICR